MKRRFLMVLIHVFVLLSAFIFSACGQDNQVDPLNKWPEYAEHGFPTSLGAYLDQACSDDAEFASYYGGSYITTDQEGLVVLYTGSQRKIQKYCENLVGKEENIRYISCDYTLRELREFDQTMKESLLNDKEIWKNRCAGCGVRVFVNRYNINTMEEGDIEKLKEELPFLSDPRIVFNCTVFTSPY